VLKLGVLMGDDIGLEVVPEAVKVMKALRRKPDWRWSGASTRSDAAATNCTATPCRKLRSRRSRKRMAGSAGRSGMVLIRATTPTWIMPPLRKRLDLFASIKPVKSYPNIPSVHKNVDIVFLREVTEGMQSSDTVTAGSGEFRPNDEISIGMRVVTRKGANRVAREAFEIARTRSRRKVTALHKEPVYRLVCGMFAEECRKVAKEYPDVELEKC